jgi:hypothetical protein
MLLRPSAPASFPPGAAVEPRSIPHRRRAAVGCYELMPALVHLADAGMSTALQQLQGAAELATKEEAELVREEFERRAGKEKKPAASEAAGDGASMSKFHSALRLQVEALNEATRVATSAMEGIVLACSAALPQRRGGGRAGVASASAPADPAARGALEMFLVLFASGVMQPLLWVADCREVSLGLAVELLDRAEREELEQARQQQQQQQARGGKGAAEKKGEAGAARGSSSAKERSDAKVL